MRERTTCKKSGSYWNPKVPCHCQRCRKELAMKQAVLEEDEEYFQEVKETSFFLQQYE